MRRQINETAGLGKSPFLSDTLSHIYHHYLSFATCLMCRCGEGPSTASTYFKKVCSPIRRPGWTLVHYAHCPRGLGVFFLECYS